MTPAAQETLTRINLDDLVTAFGWEGRPWLAAGLRGLFAGAAGTFAAQIIGFDQAVGQSNLAQAARALLRAHYVQDVQVHGLEHLPAAGPTLFLANHPGMADTLALFAAINRPDLKIIALERPFLAALPNVTRQLFFIDGDAARRMSAVRQVAAHLRSGGAVLTFPAGEIEPDPDVYPGAREALQDWTDSAGVFLRFARETQIVPVLVSSVIWSRAAHHWLPRLKRTRLEREKLAAALQLLMLIARNARPNIVRVRFAPPITQAEAGTSDPQVIHRLVRARMQALLQTQPTTAGISALQAVSSSRAALTAKLEPQSTQRS